MININPVKISGNWFDGFVLDLHTTSSELLGYDEYGHEVFNTKRSELGELLYKLKYNADKSVLPEILKVVVHFLTAKWKVDKLLHYIIPVPPSRTDRAFQPVIELAESMSYCLGVPTLKDCLIKTKETTELKNVFERGARLKLLGDAFDITSSVIKGKNVLLLDDLYRSGATVGAITRVLYNRGNVNRVYVLALTKTRTTT